MCGSLLGRDIHNGQGQTCLGRDSGADGTHFLITTQYTRVLCIGQPLVVLEVSFEVDVTYPWTCALSFRMNPSFRLSVRCFSTTSNFCIKKAVKMPPKKAAVAEKKVVLGRASNSLSMVRGLWLGKEGRRTAG